jgi:O-antigen ligase
MRETFKAELRDPVLASYLLFLVALPLVRPGSIQFGGLPAVQLSDVFLLLTYGLFGIQWLCRKEKIPWDGLLFVSIGLLAVYGVTIVLSPFGGRQNYFKLAAYAPLVLAPVLSVAILRNETRVQLAVRAWIVAAVIALAVGLVGIFAFYLHRPTGLKMMCNYGALMPGPYPRLCAPFRNFNMYCNFVSISLPILLAFGRDVMNRWLWMGLVGLSGVVAMLTLSSGIGGYAIAGALTIVGLQRLRHGSLRWWHFGVILAAFGTALLFTTASVVTTAPRGTGDVTIGGRDLEIMDGPRVSIWNRVVAGVQERPLTGLGYGELPARGVSDPRSFVPAERLAKIDAATIKPIDMEAHNQYLSVVGQTGFVGFAAFAIYVLMLAIRLRRRSDSDEHEPLRIALVAGFAGAFLFHGLFAAIEEARHVWAFFGLIAAYPLFVRPKTRDISSAL